MMQRLYTLFIIGILGVAGLRAQAPVAQFGAQETGTVYYEQGWDSAAETATWSYSATASGRFTWHVEEWPPYSSQSPFSSIDSHSRSSLCVLHSSSAQQNEWASSPDMVIRPHSRVEFYACFRSVFLVYADWRLYITDMDSEENTLLVSGFMWSQEHEFTGPAWQKFDVDLADYSGKRCVFSFLFQGPDGEDVMIDGFRLTETSAGEEAVVTISEGERVHFADRSTGHPTQWRWDFQGGSPRMSREANPVVTYAKAGVYGVKLTVSNDDGTDVLEREGYVTVVAQAPQALIGLPGVGYLSPWVAEFVPRNVPLQYHDLSQGKPTEWHWTFPGGQPAESSLQHPTVVYAENGLYGMTLTAENSVGSSEDFMQRALQVGGSQFVWNVAIDEQEQLDEISLFSYGFYGGSNTLGMVAFAEKFQQPLAPVTIDSVQVFFTRTATITPDALITVSVRGVAVDGSPGETMAQGSVRAADLVSDEHYYLPTDFALNQPVTLCDAFFVVIEGIPCRTDEATRQSDNICIMSLRRDAGGRSTTWHLLEDEAPQTYQPLGTYQWYENEEPVSLVITPRLTYVDDVASELLAVPVDTSVTTSTAIYDLMGRRVGCTDHGLIIKRSVDGLVRKVVR